MNQIEREFLVGKRFMNEEEQVNIERIKLAAMMEAAVFAGAMMESRRDVDELFAISLKIMFLDCNNQQVLIHILVQRCFEESRARGELDGFYAASLHEKTLKTYSAYFSFFLMKLVNEMIIAKKRLKDI